MDFHGVVSIVKDFYTNREKQEGRIPVGEDVIYGRVCGTDGNPPEWLSSDRDKRTVFLFGPDAIRYVTTVPPLELLYKLGADKQYLLYQIVEEQQKFWLVLFTESSSLISSDGRPVDIVPATWEGVSRHVACHYPLANTDLMAHMDILKSKSFEDFEKEAGFQFLDSKRNKNKESAWPPYFGYDYFIQLPKPTKAWEVRAFLYCELRLLKLYSGTGYTVMDNHRREQGLKEYLCPNLPIRSLLASSKCTIMPLHVTADQLDV